MTPPPAFPFPPAPSQVPDDQRAQAPTGIRYEDIAQDGTLKVSAMPQALGKLFYRGGWQSHPLQRACAATGAVAILSRLTMASLERPISAHRPLEAEGVWEVGTQRDAPGAPPKLLLNVNATLFGQRGRTHDPQPAGQGERIAVGRVHAAHVFTRPFGPAAERKVTRLELDGRSLVPDAPIHYLPAPALLEPAAEVGWFDSEFERDPVAHSFGLVHTDSNQHVNSLVYPTWFEEAFVRRLTALGESTARCLLDHIDLGFRKPCFAGDRVEIWLRCFQHAGRWGAVGYLAPEGVAPERAHVTCRMWMR